LHADHPLRWPTFARRSTLSQSPKALTIAVNVPVPDTFIWTVASFGEIGEYIFFLFGSYPPTVGSCLPFAWAFGTPTDPTDWIQLDFAVTFNGPDVPAAPQAVFTATTS